MQVIFFDYETFYDDDLSLRKMTPVEYILDPRFAVNGCAIKEGLEGKSFWLDGPDLPAYFSSLGNDVNAVSHNALFDGCVMAWANDYVPRLTTCTMSVAKAVLGHELRSVSLDSVSKHFGLPPKLGALAKVKGMYLDDIKRVGLYDQYVEYGLDDVEKCSVIYKELVVTGRFPMEELAMLDMIIRMATQPQFKLDINMVASHLNQVQQDKLQLFASAGVMDKKDLNSNNKFAALLRGVGVEPPTKISATTGKEIYAFAKTDPDFYELEEHDDPRVQALVAARFGAKSTLEETRSQRLMNIAQLTWPGNEQGRMPMPLRFSGAHTHRCSGDWKLNVQNLPRTSDELPSLRRALMVSSGYSVLTVDASQIEARLVAWICKQEDLLTQFAAGDDVYSNFASMVFEHPVSKTDISERFVGKQGILGLGFGLGHVTFQVRLRSASKIQTGTEIILSETEARMVVNTYRNRFDRIPNTWGLLQHEGIPALASGKPFQLGPVHFEKEAISLPGALKLHYHGLTYRDNEWWFTHGGKPKKLYGGMLLENIIQYLDRMIVFGAALRIQRRIAPYRLAQQAHDENAYVVRDEHLDVVQAIVMQEMHKRPDWAPDLPLMAEAGTGKSYGEAK